MLGGAGWKVVLLCSKFDLFLLMIIGLSSSDSSGMEEELGFTCALLTSSSETEEGLGVNLALLEDLVEGFLIATFFVLLERSLVIGLLL